ncbi:MAG: MGMT family protein [Clostridia bacterium]|nr:MGMT family protein [Clostridia bacterium]
MSGQFDREKLYTLLLEIPRGKVVTYGRLAEILGNRAVENVEKFQNPSKIL